MRENWKEFSSKRRKNRFRTRWIFWKRSYSRKFRTSFLYRERKRDQGGRTIRETWSLLFVTVLSSPSPVFLWQKNLYSCYSQSKEQPLPRTQPPGCTLYVQSQISNQCPCCKCRIEWGWHQLSAFFRRTSQTSYV